VNLLKIDFKILFQMDTLENENDEIERTLCPYFVYETKKDRFGTLTQTKKYHHLPVEPDSNDEVKWTLTRRNGLIFCCIQCWMDWLCQRRKLRVLEVSKLAPPKEEEISNDKP
jgi:hypothetical protein